MGNSWTPNEIAVLRQHYCVKSVSDMETLLPNRTWVAIRHKAQRLELWRPLKTTSPNQNLSVADLAYFAGLFDGEGSVILCKQPRPTPKRQTYFLSASLANTHLPTLQWVRELWGIGTIRPMKRYKESWKPRWQWVATSNQALYVLRLILPFLKIKKQEAEIGIAFQEFKLKTVQTWGWNRPTPLVKEEERLVNLLRSTPTRGGNVEDLDGRINLSTN